MNLFGKTMLFCGALIAAGHAYSHGLSEPQHGGVLTVSGDWTFELVDTDEGVTVYVYDDTVPYDTQGMSGKLKINSGDEQTEAKLKPADKHTLSAQGLDIPDSASGLVVVTLSDGYSKVGSKFKAE